MRTSISYLVYLYLVAGEAVSPSAATSPRRKDAPNIKTASEHAS